MGCSAWDCVFRLGGGILLVTMYLDWVSCSACDCVFRLDGGVLLGTVYLDLVDLFCL